MTQAQTRGPRPMFLGIGVPRVGKLKKHCYSMWRSRSLLGRLAPSSRDHNKTAFAKSRCGQLHQTLQRSNMPSKPWAHENYRLREDLFSTSGFPPVSCTNFSILDCIPQYLNSTCETKHVFQKNAKQNVFLNKKPRKLKSWSPLSASRRTSPDVTLPPHVTLSYVCQNAAGRSKTHLAHLVRAHDSVPRFRGGVLHCPEPVVA